jgi:hypothetical protein
VLLKIVYLLVRQVLGLAILMFRGDGAKDAELLVVRHEALLSRMEVEDLCLLAVAAAGWSWRQPECATRRWCFGWRCETAIALPS